MAARSSRNFNEAATRWSLIDVRVIHRIGHLLPNRQIVLTATAAAYRAQAFAACEFIIDYLKTDAPFWKREHTNNGVQWLETRDSDTQRMKRWNHPGETA
jgi:molybdopterin synthase catalytic subunit